jgi:D-tyrosyl-tRNA(Tyr) deacylase
VVGKIGSGVLIYLCVLAGDTEEEGKFLAKKVAEFRIFPDQEYKMNLSLLEVRGEALVISQFTLAADGKKGKRPSFDLAAPPDKAKELYEKFLENLQNLGIKTESGIFGAFMQVSSINNGPVTFVLEKSP